MPISDRPPRVLYCTDTYPPQLNGVSVVTALSVAGLRRRGWEVAVIAPRYPVPAFDPFQSDGPAAPHDAITTLPSCSLPMYPDLRLALPSRRAVATVVEQFRPDLVHAATEFVIGRMGQREAISRGIPVVSSYHTDFSRYTAAYGVPWLREPVQQYLRRFHLRSDRVYTPGAAAVDELRHLGIANVELWGRGVDTEIFHPRRRDRTLRQAYGCGGGAVLFLHVGRLAAEKGVERIIGAFARARTLVGSDRQIRLIIAGTGPREPSLRALAVDSGIIFLGNLDRVTMLPQLYASADAFLFASHTETLGLVVLEAMASALPVVAAPVGGVADHLDHATNGLAYRPGDIDGMAHAIARLAGSAELRHALSVGARRTAEGLSWEAELDQLDRSYREVMGRAPAQQAA
ncbi:MAG TPA: glycosyltransferase family 1 protein [Gemmatimonadales bacterium]|jgi:glycosyltransferase involved in cell wall biosynthesis